MNENDYLKRIKFKIQNEQSISYNLMYISHLGGWAV